MNGSIAALTQKKLQYIKKKLIRKQKESNNYNLISTETKFLNQTYTYQTANTFTNLFTRRNKIVPKNHLTTTSKMIENKKLPSI